MPLPTPPDPVRAPRGGGAPSALAGTPRAGTGGTDPTPRGLGRIPVWGLILLTSAIWGGNFLGIKLALRSTTPLELAALRSIVAGSLLLALARVRGRPLPNRAQMRPIFWSALFMTTLATAALTAGVGRVTAGLAALLVNTMPLFMVILAVPVLRQHPTRRALTGLAVGFAGTFLIALPAIRGETNGLGVLLILFSALAWAFGSLVMKRSDLSAVHPVMAVGIQLLISAVLLGALALLLEPVRGIDLTTSFLLAFAEITVLGLAVAWVFWAEIIRRADTSQAAATAYLVPLFGMLFGILFLDERLLAAEAAGAVLVLCGLAFVTNRRKLLPAVVPPEPPPGACSGPAPNPAPPRR